jgi:hypothetical protein
MCVAYGITEDALVYQNRKFANSLDRPRVGRVPNAPPDAHLETADWMTPGFILFITNHF